MNTKKSKHKKANKPPNPNPPQKLENVPKLVENVEELQLKCEIKEEKELAPKDTMCSEVKETKVNEIIDVKEIETETPKKPKRNKSKKKKQDKDDELVENVLEKTEEIRVEPSVQVQQSTEEIIAEEKGEFLEEEQEKDPLDEIIVVPSARKKKNKKKPQDKQIEGSKVQDILAVSEIAFEEQPTKEPENIDNEIKQLLPANPETPKQDAKKKKNKKKNRNDSERSDKSEDIMTCTSAFQKLIVDDEESKQDQTDVVIEGVQESITTIPLQQESDKKSIVEAKPAEEVKEKMTAEEQMKDIPRDEGKGKKKNKKDKKQPQQQQIQQQKQDIVEEIPVTTKEESELKVPLNDSKLDKVLESKIGKESSPTPKAKIAKPVEKKHKGKQEHTTQSSENLLNIETSEDNVKENWDSTTESEIKSEDVSIPNITESKVLEKIVQEANDTPQEAGKINIPAEGTMGKKRKKSPKLSKSKEANIKDVIQLPEKIVSKVETGIKESVETVALILSEPETKAEREESTELKLTEFSVLSTEIEMLPIIEPEVPLVDITLNLQEKKIEATESKLSDRPLTPEIEKEDEGFEIKTSRKKKKTPKMPIQVEEITNVKETLKPEVAKSEESTEQPRPCVEEKIDALIDVPSSTDIEVKRVKPDESSGSACDATPDIFFVRSSSQQLFDANNNTLIQELLNVDEIKLNESVSLPLIEGSGETPIRTPELVTSGIRLTEIEPKSPTEEKTDIKSKMMEVNQDMEELRLSIERSLAEFTAIEKSENVSENKSNVETPKKEDESSAKDKVKKDKETVTHFTKEEKVLGSEIKGGIPKELSGNEPEELSTNRPAEELKSTPPVCPARKDHKGKSKKKERQEATQATSTATTATSDVTTTQSKDKTMQEKQSKSEQKSEPTQEKGKQKSDNVTDTENTDSQKDPSCEIHPATSELSADVTEQGDFEPIENFEDALTSSIDDVNNTFDMIVEEADKDIQKKLAANKPVINITEPAEDTNRDKNEKVNPVTPPKNLLGQNNIPVQSNKTDYKKERNKVPNARQARVKIKDSMDIDVKKPSKESQTETKTKKNSDKSVKECFSKVKNDHEEYVYKYSFRKVFLQSACHVCNKDLRQIRIPCGYCYLVFYCGSKHKDENWPQHQALCFAVSTIAHMKDQKHIYSDAQNSTGQDYRLLRMQMIVSCEKVLKRRLVPWEQEAMLYPRVCADVACREWRQGKLKDCEGCGQLSYCANHPDHLPKSHQRWCKSYSLYQKLVNYQQTKGRLEPKLPTKVMKGAYEIPEKMNEVLASMYKDKIDMNDIQYAALTQLATAPLTAAYCLQLCRNKASSGCTNGVSKKQTFTIHVVGAELQFEADALNKWEIFFLHLRPDIEELKVVLVSPMLNPGNLPLDLLRKIKLCDNCLQNDRRIIFNFEDNMNYFEYRSSEDFINPNIICAFNPSIQRSSIYNGKDPWPASINSILKLKQPFVLTAYTVNELRKDIARVEQSSDVDFRVIAEPSMNNFASVRPDRNFISDDETPLLFKNYCVAVVVGC